MILSHLWPGFDQVWPNILADMIVGSVAWIWGCRVLRRARHELHERIDQLHEKHDALHAKIDEKG